MHYFIHLCADKANATTVTPNDIGLASPLSKKIKLYLRVVCLFGDCFFYHYLTQCQLDVFLQPSTR